MKLSQAEWKSYVNKLAAISQQAADEFREAVISIGGWANNDAKTIIEIAHAIAEKYGEAAGSLACDLYDMVAEAQGKNLMPAEPAKTPTIEEVSNVINSALERAPSTIPDETGKLVKKTATRTMRKNAARDGAQMALVPSGDGCAFCKMLGSRGWESARASKSFEAHLHKNCRCEYVVRFGDDLEVEGYDPDGLYDEFMQYDGDWNEKMNAMRRDYRAEHKDEINAQKRAAYANLKENNIEYGRAHKTWENSGEKSIDMAMKGTNPNFKYDLPTYLEKTRDDYTNNCTNCIPAYEMRRRGYEVTACSVGENRRLRTKPFTAWKGREPITAAGDGLEEILNYMSNMDDGSRVEISVKFPKTIFEDKSYGHVFVAEKINGEVVFLDPQSNRFLRKNIFKNVEEDATMYMRIDDLEISDRGASACKKVKK